jgi:MFS transporter, putative metabolite:H+ symporter
VFASGSFALFIWWLRRSLPESPRWLARKGRLAEAEAVVSHLESRCERELGRPLPAAEAAPVQKATTTRFADLWKPPYRRRCVMLIIFNIFQAIGFFGFGNWLPALLASQGASATHSLSYAFAIALAYPIAPLLLTRWAGHAEHKWQIVLTSLSTVVLGLLFPYLSGAVALIVCGALITFGNAWMTFAFHAYQAELFPTALRAQAVGFCYAFSRLSTAVSSPIIGLLLVHFGSSAVLAFISGSMLIVAAVIGLFGPSTHMRSLEEISS